MAANDFFRRQLASYASVHRDPRNKATHFVGIPMIIFSLLLVTSPWQIEFGDRTLSAATILAILGVLGWLLLDIGIGVAMAVIMLPTWFAAEALAGALGPSSTWIAFAVLFVGGWALQFLGHYYEGKRPALIDNIFQAFVGPMFLVAEIMVEAGWRHDLATAVSEGDVSTL
jgi:uncharacterized membrane protein YGL010W